VQEYGVIRVLISDRGPIFRDGVQALLQTESDLTVVGQASTPLEAIEQVRALQPDVLLHELEPRRSGIDLVRKLSAEGSPVRTVLLADVIERPDVSSALQAGARGVFPKDSGTSLLFKCIRSVMTGQYWIGREGVADLVSMLSRVRPDTPVAPKANFGLTGRETQILLAVVEGLTNRQIAEQLSISHDTVKHHVRKVFTKVGVSKRVELAVFAMNHHLGAFQPAT
jgi:DNA-binding NarL/FixJ family response regulator